MGKKLYLLFLLLVSAIVLVACNNIENGTETIEVTDFVGDVVSVPKNPKKVAVVARSAADMLIAFGLGDNIDGLYKTIFDNPWATYLYPGLNEYYKYEYNENYEIFYSRGIDLIFAPEKYIAEDLRSKGLNAITVSQYGSPTYEEVLFRLPDLIAQIWDDESVHEKVTQWKQDFMVVKNEIFDKLDKPEILDKTLYYIRGDKYNGLNYTETKGSKIETFGAYLNLKFLGEYFDHNNRPSEEAVLNLNPTYIITGGIYQNQIIDELYTNEAWNKLDAVKEDNVFNIGIGFVMFEQTSVEEYIFLADLANQVYPDIFDFDIEFMLKETIKTYFDVDLTDDKVNYMLSGLDKEGNSLIQSR
jgi:iron complex transport system substrate-binding protein